MAIPSLQVWLGQEATIDAVPTWIDITAYVRLEAGITEDHRQGHRETACVGCANQFFGVGALTAFEPRLEAIRRFTQYAGFSGDGADAGFKIACPMSRCFLFDTHACLLKNGAKVSRLE